MRLVGVVFLVVFVPESLAYNPPRTHPVAASFKHGLNGVLRQGWVQKIKNANPLAILSSKSGMDAESRRNVIALAAVNTIMFGAFMGAMNVMLLYSEVRVHSLIVQPSISRLCSRETL